MFQVLCVCTSTFQSSWGAETGLWLEELTSPYYLLSEAGYTIDICSIAGGSPSIDPAALRSEFQSDSIVKFLNDEEAQEKFKDAKSLESIVQNGKIKEYCALYLCGGHGCVDDFYENNSIKRAVEYIYNTKKGCVGAVCHGPFGLVKCLNEKGTSLLKGKFVAAFSNEEEESLGLLNTLPVRTEDKVDEAGAICVPAAPWKANVVVDARLVTGQNPNSSQEMAFRMLDVLRTLGKDFNAPENINKPWGT